MKKIIQLSLILFILFSSISYALDLSEYFPIYYGYAGLYKNYSSESDATDIEYEIDKIYLMVLNGEQVFKVQEGGSIYFPQEKEGSFWLYKWTPVGLKVYGFFDTDVSDNIVYFNPPKILLPKELNVGETVTTDLATVSLISTNENISVPAGVFNNCAHVMIQFKGEVDCFTDIWFAKHVGIVKIRDFCPDEVEISELVAARLNNRLIGYPFCNGKNVSFAFSIVRTSGCSLIIDGISIKGSTDTFWARLDLDFSDFTFKPLWDYIGIGYAPSFNLVCPVAGLTFSEYAYTWDCINDYSANVGLFLTAYYQNTPFYLEIAFDEANVLFSIIRIWDQNYNLIWSRNS